MIDKWSPELISVKGIENGNVLSVMNVCIIGFGNLSIVIKEEIDQIKNFTCISNTVREGVREEIVKIDEVLFQIEYQLKHNQNC